MKKKYNVASQQEAAHVLFLHRKSNQYKWIYSHRFATVSGFIPNTTAPQRLLDFGCGDGSFLRYLQEHRHSLNLHGYDPYFTTDEISRLNGIQMHKDIRAIGNMHFDFVVAIEVIEHIKDDYSALQQISKLLKPNGTLIITVPVYNWLYSSYDASIGHYRRYSRHSIVKLLEQARFSVQYSTHFYFSLITALMLLKFLDFLGKKDFTFYGNKLNKIYKIMTNIEYKLFHKKNKFYLPWGTSILVVARKMDD